MTVKEKLKRTIAEAAEESGKILADNFGGKFKISSKAVVSNLVTEIDHKSEQKIISIIRRDFPDHSILTEESEGLTKDSDYRWIIDPIDGTVNYAHGIPITCVSIAVEKKGEVILGVVYNPMGGEYFFAEKGKGAFLNNRRISVSKNSDIEKSLLVTGFPYNSSTFKPNPVRLFRKFIMLNVPIRRLGSAALDLCWTACGRFDGFWEYNLNAWDVAAGSLILQEAGGKLSNFKGGKYSIHMKEILATNGRIHSNMLKIINS
jgi:myo-inositol-1(or 4)-monophosphatase